MAGPATGYTRDGHVVTDIDCRADGSDEVPCQMGFLPGQGRAAPF